MSPQSTPAGCVLPPSSSLHQQSQGQDQEDKLIYDMDSKSTTKNQSLSSPTTLLTKRKRHISVEETEDAISSILPKKLKGGDGGEKEADLNDSGYQDQDQDQEENQVNFILLYFDILNSLECILFNTIFFFMFAKINSNIYQ